MTLNFGCTAKAPKILFTAHPETEIRLGFVAVDSETRPTWKAMLLVRPLWSRQSWSCATGESEYDKKRQELYEHYHPLEFSPTIPIEEKAKLMEEWWTKTHGLLIEGGLTYDGIRQSVADSTIAFREGVVELFEFLEERDIPILIFSAGLADIIEEVLRQKIHRLFKNVKIVSNRMVFNNNGHLVSFQGKTIHSLNKNEHALDMAAPLHDRLGDNIDAPTYENASVKTRRNVLLLGDHIGDLGMSDGLNYENRISADFCKL
ncbi:5'-nucleotidase [Prunus dulcis]|uniref:5'-nucleotidase n=1 Tax=Prunus dulcis TaxID=3755 RepID=A0A5H2XQ67_PRUDU|nr:5'-nucleotidase [Prunus dulcis]